MNSTYCTSLTKFERRTTSPVKVGNAIIGGNNPYCLQTMTNTSTSDIEGTAEQVITSYNAGAKIVRITVPSIRDVENLRKINECIKSKGYSIPLVADVHFNHQIAFEAAKIVEKVRINPGNFADTKKFEQLALSSGEYKAELDRIESVFVPLLEICKQYHTALRIGTNHGSLSDRIMSRFGDTPEGMAESAMEFLRICKKQNFDNVVISMKASNTLVMVQATRLLVSKMMEEEMHYPVHLGVTEAGEGEDGRIKSAVGVGALLADGIGDTIRISLTEPPEQEIPVAKKLAEYFESKTIHKHIENIDNYPVNPFRFNRRVSNPVLITGGVNPPVVLADKCNLPKNFDLIPDYIIDEISGKFIYQLKDISQHNLLYFKNLSKELYSSDDPALIETSAGNMDAAMIAELKKLKGKILILNSENSNSLADQRAAIVRLIQAGIQLPVILKREYFEDDVETLQVKASADLGGLFIDGLVDGLWLKNTGSIPDQAIISTAFGILQASRMRMTRPEYISCPSCGRTMFDLQDTTKKIREKTAHLKGLKIGIMGCIVNGLGEMADADYGYIGSGPGKVNLYYNRELVKRGVSENNAVDELVNLIKEKGDWIES